MKKEWDAAVKALKKFGDETEQYVTLTHTAKQYHDGDFVTYYQAYSAEGTHTEECLTPMDAVIQCINKYKEEVKKRA